MGQAKCDILSAITYILFLEKNMYVVLLAVFWVFGSKISSCKFLEYACGNSVAKSLNTSYR